MATSKKRMESPQLGEGIYFIRDVARLLDLPYHKVRSVFSGFWQSYTFGEDRNKAVNFYSLIEFYLYFHCRQNGMSAQKIKKFHDQFSKDLGTRYPFAHYEIKTDFKSMWARESGNLLKGDGKQQYDFLPILDKFLHKVSYGENNIANKYYPLEKTKAVVVDPRYQFGQPVVEGTGIKTKTIYSLHLGGESNQRISNLYNIPVKKVRDAIKFHEMAA